MMKLQACLTLFCLTLLSAGAAAQTLVEDPSGFRAQIPAGFRVRQAGAGVIANDDGGTIGLIVRAHPHTTLQAFMAQTTLHDDGFSLVENPQMLGPNAAHFRSEKTDPWGGRTVADTFVSFAPGGGGCLVVSLAHQASAKVGYESALQVISSLEFFSTPAQ